MIFLKSTLIDAANVYLRQPLKLGILMQYFKVLMPFVWSSENIHARNDTMFITGFTFYYFYVQSKEVRTANSASNINDIWSVK